MSDAPGGQAAKRPQATHSLGTLLLCILDLLLVPLFVIAGAIAGGRQGAGLGGQALFVVLIAAAIASAVCAVLGFISGLAGAPRRQVLLLTGAPALLLLGFFTLMVAFG